MSFWEAVVLGVVQGLTEFLPISSSAHLRIVPALLGWTDPGAAFTAVIQIGSLVAVVAYFWRDIVRIARAWIAGLLAGSPWTDTDARLGWMMIVGTLPIVACGLVFRESIETSFRSLYVIAVTLIALALLLALAELLVRRRVALGRSEKQLDRVSWLDAMIVGLAQAAALVPGVSRSGVTITAGLFAGLSRETAARFSFLLSLPSILAAGLYQLYKARDALLSSQQDAVALAISTLLSGVVGYLSIAFLLRFLKTHTTYVFIVYRLALGAWLILLSRGTLVAAAAAVAVRG